MSNLFSAVRTAFCELIEASCERKFALSAISVESVAVFFERYLMDAERFDSRRRCLRSSSEVAAAPTPMPTIIVLASGALVPSIDGPARVPAPMIAAAHAWAVSSEEEIEAERLDALRLLSLEAIDALS